MARAAAPRRRARRAAARTTKQLGVRGRCVEWRRRRGWRRRRVELGSRRLSAAGGRHDVALRGRGRRRQASDDLRHLRSGDGRRVADDEHRGRDLLRVAPDLGGRLHDLRPDGGAAGGQQRRHHVRDRPRRRPRQRDSVFDPGDDDRRERRRNAARANLQRRFAVRGERYFHTIDIDSASSISRATRRSRRRRKRPATPPTSPGTTPISMQRSRAPTSRRSRSRQNGSSSISEARPARWRA